MIFREEKHQKLLTIVEQSGDDINCNYIGQNSEGEKLYEIPLNAYEYIRFIINNVESTDRSFPDTPIDSGIQDTTGPVFDFAGRIEMATKQIKTKYFEQFIEDDRIFIDFWIDFSPFIDYDLVI